MADWNPRVIAVIETFLLLRGSGTPTDPYRRVRQYYTLDGALLAEHDDWRDEPRGASTRGDSAVDPSAANTGTHSTRV